MATPISRTETQCIHCKQWVNAPIQFGTVEAFESASVSGNTMTCPHCRKVSPCNRENSRHYREDGKGGHVGMDVRL